MTMAIVTARVPDEKKKAAVILAKELWIPLWSLINVWINDFLRNQSINVSLDDTSVEYYNTPHAIEINENIDTVIDFIDKSLLSDG